MAETYDLWNANDAVADRSSGGPYLDRVEQENAENARAKVEGRKPDLKNLQPTVGSHLVNRAAFIALGGDPDVVKPIAKGTLPEDAEDAADVAATATVPTAAADSTAQVDSLDADGNPTANPTS